MEANNAYCRRRALERAKGRENPLIDAGQVKARLEQLEAKGVTPRRVGKLANVRWVQLYRIKSGEQRYIRKLTAEAVLSVTPTAHDAFALTNGYHTRQLIDGLRSEDLTHKELARRLRLKSPSVQLHNPRVTVRNALKIRGFYRWIMGED